MSTCYTCRRREANITGRCDKCELDHCYRCKERQQRIEKLEAEVERLRAAIGILKPHVLHLDAEFVVWCPWCGCLSNSLTGVDDSHSDNCEIGAALRGAKSEAGKTYTEKLVDTREPLYGKNDVESPKPTGLVSGYGGE